MQESHLPLRFCKPPPGLLGQREKYVFDCRRSIPKLLSSQQAMEIVGAIVEIFSERHLLLQLSKKVDADTVLTVYSELSVPSLEDKYGLSVIHLPKGEIRVLSEQSGGFYLAESFRTAVTRPVYPNMGLLAGLITQETIQGPLSAKLASPTTSVDLRVDKEVKVGDAVGVP